jgi:hypothetical protein
MPFHEDDWVEILDSKVNYTGPGKLVAPAYGNTWLVQVDRGDDKPGVITVRETHMKDRGGPPRAKEALRLEVDDESQYREEQLRGLTEKQIKRLERRRIKKANF